MKTRIRKCGNKLAILIPQAIALEMGLEANSLVEISVENGTIVITRAYTLDELLQGVTEQNLHGEIDTGVAMGNEAW